MNIFLFGNAFPPIYMGGESIHLENLASGLRKRGHRLFVVHPVPTMDEKPRVELYHPKPGIEVFRICLSERNNCTKQLNSMATAVCKKLLQQGHCPDVIHCHSTKFGLCVEEVANCCRVPVVTTIHAIDSPLVHSVAESKGLLFDSADGELYRKDTAAAAGLCAISDRIVAISRAMEKLINRYYHPDPKKIAVIHNGVDIDRLGENGDLKAIKKLKTALDLENSENVILFAGRIEPIKGIKPFAMACKNILSERDDVGLVFLGNGSGDDWLRSYLSGCEKVRFIDWLPFEDVIRYYHLADIVVVPSLIEPFGLVAVEALACRNCVIASNADGLKEVITPDIDGIQIPLIIDEYGDRTISHQDIYGAIIKAISAPKWRASLADRGLLRAREFSLDTMVGNIEKLYRDVINECVSE